MLLPNDVCAHMATNIGLVSSRDLRRMGYPPSHIESWIRHGVLEIVTRGVYRLRGACAPEEQAAAAQVIRYGDRARAGPVVSLALHSIEGFPLPEFPDVVLAAPTSVRRRSSGATVSVITLPATDKTTRNGVPCLTVTRGFIELPTTVEEKVVRVGIDDAKRHRYTSNFLLRTRAEALMPRPGAARILRIMRSGALKPASEGERIMRDFLAPLGLELEWGVEDVVPGRVFDAFYRAGRVEFEWDGRDHHVLPTDRDADGLRDLEIAEQGVLTIRITSGMVRDAPADTLARIAAICEARRRAFAGS